MTLARPVFPESLVHSTRRCLEQRMFMHPTDKRVVHATKYLVAWVCEKYGVGLVATCFMSTHSHTMIDDYEGVLPNVNRDLNGMLGRVINALRGRSGRFWDGQQVNVVDVQTRAATLKTMAYIMANPVAAGAVERGRDWPGLRTNPQLFLGRSETVDRPEFFFSERTVMPATVELRHTIPSCFKDMERGEFVRLLAAQVGEEEAEARAEVRAQGRRFLGLRRLKKMHWDDSVNPTVRAHRRSSRVEGSRGYLTIPPSPEEEEWANGDAALDEGAEAPGAGEEGAEALAASDDAAASTEGSTTGASAPSGKSLPPRRKRSGPKPRVATQDRDRHRQALDELRYWNVDYEDKRDRWCGGDRDVVFPAGTWKMRVLHGVRCRDRRMNGPP